MSLSDGLKELKAMRKWVKDYSPNTFIDDIKKLEKICELENYKGQRGEVGELARKMDILSFYNTVLSYAEKAERRKKGGGTAFFVKNEKKINKIIKYLNSEKYLDKYKKHFPL